MKNSFIIIIVTLLASISCQNRDSQIESIINKYNKVNFDRLRNTAIFFRSMKTRGNVAIYLVQSFSDTCSPYIVEFDIDKHRAINISNHLVIASCGCDYLGIKRAEEIIDNFNFFDLSSLKIDLVGNVYFTTFIENSPIFLRKVPGSTPNEFNKFTHFQSCPKRLSPPTSLHLQAVFSLKT